MAKKKEIEPAELPDRSEINNALRPLRVDITQDDIENGTAMDPTNCAAALAILRVTGAEAVRVHRGVTLVKSRSGKWQRYITSAGLRMETIVYDRGGQFIAGEYDLKPVPLSYNAKTHKKTKKAGMTNKLSQRRRTIPNVRMTARQNPKPEEGDE